MIARLTAAYLLIFALVLAVLSFAAYTFVGTQYHSLLLPALGTPEGVLAYALAMRHVAGTIAAFDLPLLLIVGVAAWILARVSIQPLLSARERERSFVADVAHELRSPLATISSIAQAHRAAAQPETVRDALTLIATTAVDASGLIGDMLTLARTPGAQLLSREPVDLAAVVRVCVREFQPQIEGAGLTVEVQAESAIVNGDERRLRELIRNVVENALRHARTRITIRCAVEGDRALLQIADDGLGVDVSDRERIFERFFRADGDARGSGLGLAIAQWVARAHDGLLVLDDVPSGASFTARIPLLR